MYGSSDMECNRWNFLSFWTIFCPFISLTTQKIKMSKKWKTTWRYYHFKHVYHKWKSYDVWFLRYGTCDGQNFLSFWTIFCHFTPLTTQKIKILKKWKNSLEILSFYICVPEMTIIWGMVPEISSVMDRIICHFGLF